jgi:DNA polymerase-3 subunit alpha
VNASSYRFVAVDRDTVRYGLGAVRGTGESAIGAILAAREKRTFHEPVRPVRARATSAG